MHDTELLRFLRRLARIVHRIDAIDARLIRQERAALEVLDHVRVDGIHAARLRRGAMQRAAIRMMLWYADPYPGETTPTVAVVFATKPNFVRVGQKIGDATVTAVHEDGTVSVCIGGSDEQ